MKINVDPFLKALLLLIIFSAVAAFFRPSHQNSYRKLAKMKSILKQIGTSVAMYYTDGESNKYPANPGVFEIDEHLIYTKETSNWLEISLNSPYLFLPNDGDEYTGSPEKALAINWEHHNIPPYYQVVWEDGHVSTVSKEEAKKLMHSSFKNSLTVFLYKMTFRNNEAVK